MPPPTENFLHIEKEAKMLAETPTSSVKCTPHSTQRTFTCHKFARLLGCLETCSAALILSDPTAQADDASDTRPFHVDAKGGAARLILTLCVP